MPRLSTLISDFADRFSFEATKLNSLARVMREGGLITSGARGVNAPAATSLDASRLLIAMMLDSKMPTVTDDVRIVGGFKVLDEQSLTPGFRPTNLEEGLALLLDFFGSFGENSDFTAYFELVPYAALAEIMIAKIPEDATAKETKVSFTHPDVHPGNISALPESYFKAAARFPIGFMQRPVIERHNLIAIGQLIKSADQ